LKTISLFANVGIDRLGAHLAQHAEQPHGPLIAYGGQAHEPVVCIRFPEPLLTDAEVMHVAVFPPHSQLQHVMQLLQGQIRGHQQPTPNRWARAEQSDFDLIEKILPRCRRCRGIFVTLGSVIYEHPAKSGLIPSTRIFSLGHLLFHSADLPPCLRTQLTCRYDENRIRNTDLERRSNIIQQSAGIANDRAPATGGHRITRVRCRVGTTCG